MYKGKIYGYVRCSTKEQHADRQIIAMKEFGVPEKNIVVEKMSGKDFNRPLYKKLIKKLKPNDTIVIKSIDRLGRKYSEIVENWKYIANDIGAMIIVLDFPILAHNQDGLNLTNRFVADLILAILSYVSEMERSLNHQRQAEGIAAAKLRGVRFGRKPKERPELYSIVQKLWQSGKISAREAGKRLGISHTTFLAWAREG